jgi:hypothetical protein
MRPDPGNCVLGFQIDSRDLKVAIPEVKLNRFLTQVKEVLLAGQLDLYELSNLSGEMNSFSSAVLPGHLHFRSLERFLANQLAQNKTNYNTIVILSAEVRKDLLWWRDCMRNFNGKRLRFPEVQLSIHSDRSLFRWGAFCNEKLISYAWPKHNEDHINIKELQAALLAWQAFVPQPFPSLATVELFLDNYWAVYAINRFGSSRCEKLNNLALELWHEAIDKNAYLRAIYIPGKLNVEADWASRFFEDSSDWQLDKTVFSSLNRQMGPLTIDLFASFLNNQLPNFFSWFPDPKSQAVDAPLQVWPREGAYAFPPFVLIPKVLNEIQQEHLSILLIAPNWPQQRWFPRLLTLLRDHPVFLPEVPNLLLNPRGHAHPLLANNSLQLRAWPLSGRPNHQQEFLKKLPFLLETPCENQPGNLILAAGKDGIMGVVQGRLILGTQLS